MFNKFKKIFFLVYLVVVLLFPYFVFAQNTKPSVKLEAVAVIGGYPETSFAGILAMVIQTFLGLLGIVFLVLIVYAGYNWMTSAGNEEKITKAKDTLKTAIIGLIIIVSAYAITYFAFNALSDMGQGGSSDGPSGRWFWQR